MGKKENDAGEGGAKKPERMRAVLIVRTRKGTRRRAGLSFGPEAVELNAADLTTAQIAAIEADTELVTSRGERPEYPAPKE